MRHETIEQQGFRRDEAGHADHFWSFALALEAAGSAGGPFAYRSVPRLERGVVV